MPFLSILLLAIGLSMDATAVAATRGATASRLRVRDVAIVAGLFGGFQALMPLLGWWLGSELGPFVEAWDHWIAFVLLAGIGGKMLWEGKGDWVAVSQPTKPDPPIRDPFRLRVLLLLAVATSVDAFAVGITLPMLDAPFLLSLLTIGITTALLSAAGLLAARKLEALRGPILDTIGGLVLVGFGLKILVEHLVA